VAGNKEPEIVYSAGEGFNPYFPLLRGGVHTFDSGNRSVEGFPKITESYPFAPAVVDDIDEDGKLELVASSYGDYDYEKYYLKLRGSIYVWELNATYNQSNMPWPMFHHDTGLTGCYDCKTDVCIPKLLRFLFL